MAFIRKVKTASGATAVQVAHSVYGRIVRIDHIGSAHNPAELELLTALAQTRLTARQSSLFDPEPVGNTIRLKQSASDVLYGALREQYDTLGLGRLQDDDFANLVIARLVEPTSKLDSVRVLADLGIDTASKDQLHRCLKRIIANDYRSKLAELCFAHASQGKGVTLVLYDVTTLYFETRERDEDTYRQPGMSKERRLEPQIIVGLLVDQNGFPLELHSFEGNKAETKTILPVVEAFRQRHGLVGITVVADAGMLSQDNLKALSAAGYTYIVGSRLHKVPYGVEQYRANGKELSDNQIITNRTAVKGQRIIYQYREKRAKLDLRNIDKQIAKAQKIVDGKTPVKRAKFLSVTAGGKQTKALNQTLIDKAKALAGIKGYVTNLPTNEAGNATVIAYYHQLWHVEQTFRMSKSDLKARPIFHHKREAIEAHLTVVMAALAIGRTIEQRTDLSVKRFIKQLRTVRSGVVVIDGKEYLAAAEIPKETARVLRKLRRTH